MNDAPTDTAPSGLLDRALRRIGLVWRDMAASVAGETDDSIEAQIRACLNGRGGEVSARNRAAKLAETYESLDDAGRREFLRTLATFDSDPEAVDAAYAAVRTAEDPAARAIATTELRRALEATAAAPADPVHHHPERAKVPGRPARLPAARAP